MTKKGEQKIYEDALETLADLKNIPDGKALTKDQFILYGAANGIIASNIHDVPVAASNEYGAMGTPREEYKMPSTIADFSALVEDELHDAAKYLALYKHSGSESHKQLARQEESHAMYWISEAKKVVSAPVEHGRIKQWQKRHDEILAQLV